MWVYVASKFELKERVREIMFLLVSAGHHITFDWTHTTQMNLSQMMADVRGIQDADVFVLIVEDDAVTYRGALVEMGMALALGKPVYVIGEALDDKLIFLLHPNIKRGYAAFKADLLT